MSISVQATLCPVQLAATHVVESSLTTLPQIVERTTACGTLKIHIPLTIPDRIQLRVERVDSHSFDAPTSVAIGRNVVMQGEVVRIDGHKMLVSHGGMLMHIECPTVKCFGDATDLVRTTVTF
jgi:hypothetical protein